MVVFGIEEVHVYEFVCWNRNFCHSWHSTQTNLLLRLIQNFVVYANDMNLFLIIFPYIGVNCKLVSE